MSVESVQRVRDPVHGLIAFGGGTDAYQNETDEIAWRLVNTPEFQRLRRIRQLGFSDLVYPGATHSRLAHCLGVYHTARELVEVIRRRECRFDREKARVSLLAALLHDIGHGPFSHVFETATATSSHGTKTHEAWGADIVLGETGVNGVLTDVDSTLPEQVASLLRGEDAKDIYATVVSSQFDADRLDYIQRDRQMTGVQFGHLDREWLLDCLEVGHVTIDENAIEAPCLYLSPKGLEVAEEYVQARFRLYTMVYMHKTTRAAEKMLGALLASVASRANPSCFVDRDDPISRYFHADEPTLGEYLALDDATIWAGLARYTRIADKTVASLARRLRERQLYKCIDVASHDVEGGNLHLKFKNRLNNEVPNPEKFLVDDASVTSYKWFDFESESVLNKVLVKKDQHDSEPSDIFSLSPVIRALQPERRIFRVYAPDQDSLSQARKLLESLR